MSVEQAEDADQSQELWHAADALGLEHQAMHEIAGKPQVAKLRSRPRLASNHQGAGPELAVCEPAAGCRPCRSPECQGCDAPNRFRAFWKAEPNCILAG